VIVIHIVEVNSNEAVVLVALSIQSNWTLLLASVDDWPLLSVP
jgi:hypothetical protein